jgi:hypothetical protein
MLNSLKGNSSEEAFSQICFGKIPTVSASKNGA